MKGPTLKQQAVLHCIEERLTAQGVPPTVREIGHRLGITVATVQAHINALVRKGLLTRPRAYAYRGLQLPGVTCACGEARLLTDAAGRHWCRSCARTGLASVKLAEVTL